MGTTTFLYDSMLFNVKSKVKPFVLLPLPGKLSPHWPGQLSICGKEVEPVSGYSLEIATAPQRPGFEFCPQLFLCESRQVSFVLWHPNSSSCLTGLLIN